MKLASIIALSLFSLGAYAHDNQCDVHIEGSLKFSDQIITVSTQDDQRVEIYPDYRVKVDGDELELSASQTALVQRYYEGIEQAVPMTYDIAQNALSLAKTGITEAFGEILGKDDKLIVEVSEFFDDINTDIKHGFYLDNGEINFSIDEDADENFVSPQVRQEIEDKMSSLVERSIGRLLIAIGTQMSKSDGSQSFEERMETFAQTIEEKMEFESVLIEGKADRLCDVLAKVDDAETQISQTIKPLKSLNILNVESEEI